MGLIFFKTIRRKLNKGVLLLPEPASISRSPCFKLEEHKGDFYLSGPNCPMWCMGVFCIKSYENHICLLNRIISPFVFEMDDPADYKTYYSSDDSTDGSIDAEIDISTDSTNNSEMDTSASSSTDATSDDEKIDYIYSWERGRVRCTWPEFSRRLGPPDNLEESTIISKTARRRLCDENFEKVVKLIENPQMQENLKKAVAGAPGYFKNAAAYSPFDPYSYGSRLNQCPRRKRDGIFNTFRHIVNILNALFWRSGLIFDMENVTVTDHFAASEGITKSDHFATTASELSKQVNVRIQKDLFVRHILPEYQQTDQSAQVMNTFIAKSIRLRDNKSLLESKIKTHLKKESHNKVSPFATLIVASGEDPIMGGGYGAIQNCGIEIPSGVKLNRYMGDEDEVTRAKLENKCKLQHRFTTDDAAKYGIDRQCMSHIGYDCTFWQVSHLSDNPDFSKWNKDQDLPRLSEHNLREVDLERYPEVKYDESSLFFNEDEDPGVFYRLVCVTLDSLFELIPELKNDELLKATVNGEKPDKLDVQNLHKWLQRGIKERAPLFQEYLKNYEQYHPKNMSKQTKELLEALPSRDINSCTIVSDLSTSTQEAYEVKVDDLAVKNATFELLLFPVKYNQFNGRDLYDVVHCISEFKHGVRVFRALSECEFAADIYDYGKLEYIDEYGNEQLKLFILKEKTIGRVPCADIQGDLDLLKVAKRKVKAYISKEELKKLTVLESDFPRFEDHTKMFSTFQEIQWMTLKDLGVELIPDFRVVDENFVKLFGFVTSLDEKKFLEAREENIF